MAVVNEVMQVLEKIALLQPPTPAELDTLKQWIRDVDAMRQVKRTEGIGGRADYQHLRVSSLLEILGNFSLNGSNTGATGAELETLTGGGNTALHKHTLPFVFVQDTAAQPPYSANASTHMLVVSNDMTLTAAFALTYVATTNTSSHYWTVEFKRLSDGAVIASFDTSADSADAWVRHTDATLSITSLVAANKGAYVSVTKTGTPGALLIESPMFTGTY